jgi:hypothetical protein
METFFSPFSRPPVGSFRVVVTITIPYSDQKFILSENCMERLSTIVEVMRPAVGESKF